ncbi:Translin-associated protein X [Choanephora cucurbitarum]|uniref:Translin-associated protein X n=1 Tax=Choanephora cucurbitarum TaxID=101091 RepID=A0A1C7N7S9_9FUNG|nr:Translin-associated protein X [Choanephora cucurbitarum]
MSLQTQAFFKECRDVLDDHHDRRERIIKVSRDITAQSKKMIFALHRAAQSNQKYKEADQKQAELLDLFKKLAIDIQGLNYHRYAKSFSGGFEEFIEAVAFYHFLLHQDVISKEQIDNYFKDEQGNMITCLFTPTLQILGLADFTGELMRHAIHVVSTGRYEQALNICKLLRKIDLDFEIVSTFYMPQLNKKLGALKSSIKKVEQACYTFQIRGSEYPKEMYLSIIKNHQERYEQEQQEN